MKVYTTFLHDIVKHYTIAKEQSMYIQLSN